MAAGPLLPGTPGSLTLRDGTGHAYWYRTFYSVPGKAAETLVGREDNTAAADAMRQQIEFAKWTSEQVTNLRKLGFQVADKSSARVLVELHNRGAFDAGLVLVGTLGYMAWLNEYGAAAVSARTLDIDLARRQTLKLAAPLAILETLANTGLPFCAVPGLPSMAPATSLKLPGRESLRVDILAPGATLGAVVPVPELQWAAQTVPFYDYLLANPEPGAMLAGWQCIPVRLPQPARFVWHKCYSSLHRCGFKEKAEKDRLQALTLAAVLLEDDPEALGQAFSAAPASLVSELRRHAATLFTGAAVDPVAGALREIVSA